MRLATSTTETLTDLTTDLVMANNNNNRCVQLNRWYVGVFYIGGRGERCGVFRRLCVDVIGIYRYDIRMRLLLRRVSLGEFGSSEGEFGRGDLRGVLMYEFVMVAL